MCGGLIDILNSQFPRQKRPIKEQKRPTNTVETFVRRRIHVRKIDRHSQQFSALGKRVLEIDLLRSKRDLLTLAYLARRRDICEEEDTCVIWGGAYLARRRDICEEDAAGQDEYPCAEHEPHLYI